MNFPALFETVQKNLRLPKWIEGPFVRRIRQQLSSRFPPNNATAEKQTELVIDLSVISDHDPGTGIQRVVNAIYRSLEENPPHNCHVTTASGAGKLGYRYIQGRGADKITGGVIQPNRGDCFIGLDFSTHAIFRHRKQLYQLKSKGVRFVFLIHDLLPELEPLWFTARSVTSYRRWIRVVSTIADHVVCNSKDTERKFRQFVKNRYGFGLQEIETSVIPLGWDFRASSFTKGLSASFERIFPALQETPFVLMVGTIEPRKGHWALLKAFDSLWAQYGSDYKLVLVGRPGWNTDDLQAEILNHPHFCRGLYWFSDASDEVLELLYGSCAGVIVGSKGEGFGLPVIEAVGHRKPVLARSLDVYRDFGLSGVSYFHDDRPDQLANRILQWLQEIESGAIGAGEVPVYNWNESYRTFVSSCGLILSNRKGSNCGAA